MKWYAKSMGFLFITMIALVLIYFGMWFILVSSWPIKILLLFLVLVVGFPLVVYTFLKFVVTLRAHL